MVGQHPGERSERGWAESPGGRNRTALTDHLFPASDPFTQQLRPLRAQPGQEAHSAELGPDPGCGHLYEAASAAGGTQAGPSPSGVEEAGDMKRCPPPLRGGDLGFSGLDKAGPSSPTPACLSPVCFPPIPGAPPKVHPTPAAVASGCCGTGDKRLTLSGLPCPHL